MRFLTGRGQARYGGPPGGGWEGYLITWAGGGGRASLTGLVGFIVGDFAKSW